MRLRQMLWFSTLVVACLAGRAALAQSGLPEAVKTAVNKAFPNATIRSFGRERESGVRYYEVNLLLNGNRIEVEVDSQGGIGEIERRISVDEAPEKLRKAAAEFIADGGIVRIERHERWGRRRDGRFDPLPEPHVFYEVKLSMRGKNEEGVWMPERPRLPDAVEAKVEQAFSGAVLLEGLEREEGGVKLYSVLMVKDAQDTRAELAEDGTILSVETAVDAATLPEAVVASMRQAAGEAAVRQVTRREVRARVEDGKVKALAPPEIVYGARLLKGRMIGRITVAADGKVLEELQWRAMEDDPDDDADDDDDDDDDEDDDDDD